MANNTTCESMEVVSFSQYAIVTMVFFIGVIGNIAALWILYKSAKSRNKKHVLMLRCLATNDLIAEVGMFTIITLLKYELIQMRWICVGFVLLRSFGIGSGCVAFVMALERWLALTRPFHYHQLVTYQMIKIVVISLWSFGAFITYLPLLGFGLYYKNNNLNGQCCRYRDAKELRDQIYAYMFFTFGTALCLCIVYFNLRVIWELSKIRPNGRGLVRRVSRNMINCRLPPVRYQTPEEIAFAKLMAIICIIFVTCWTPQMISIPLAQFTPNSNFDKVFAKLANFLMSAYFTLDPYVYVLQRYIEKKKVNFDGCCMRRPTFSSSVSGTTGTPTSVLLIPPSFASPSVM